MVRLLFGGGYTDLCYGYNAFWRRVLPQLQLDGEGFEIETMMNVRALKAGLLISEVPSFESRRIYGVSNLRTFRDGMRVLRTIFRERIQTTPTAAHGFGEELDGARLAVIVPIATSGRIGLHVADAVSETEGHALRSEAIGSESGSGHAEAAVAR